MVILKFMLLIETNIMNTICPVPVLQIPIEEYKALSTAYFFSWSTKGESYLYKRLFYIWLITLPFTTTLSYGSLYLKSHIPILIITSLSLAFESHGQCVAPS